MGQQTMDSKGRITIPSDLRNPMKIKKGTRVALEVKKGELHLYKISGFRRRTRHISEASMGSSRDRMNRRRLLSRYSGEEVDEQGRVTVPGKLRKELEYSEDGQIGVVYHR